jgi:hypothetical protein
MPATGEIRAQQGHTRAGAAWRGAVVLCAAAVAIPAAAWLGSKLVGYDTRLAMVAAVPAACAVGLPTVLWLRARNGLPETVWCPADRVRGTRRWSGRGCRERRAVTQAEILPKIRESRVSAG